MATGRLTMPNTQKYIESPNRRQRVINLNKINQEHQQRSRDTKWRCGCSYKKLKGKIGLINQDILYEMPKEPIKYILYIIYLYILKENVAEVHQLVLQLLLQHLLTV